jgi:hypothetical protein
MAVPAMIMGRTPVPLVHGGVPHAPEFDHRDVSGIWSLGFLSAVIYVANEAPVYRLLFCNLPDRAVLLDNPSRWFYIAQFKKVMGAE